MRVEGRKGRKKERDRRGGAMPREKRERDWRGRLETAGSAERVPFPPKNQ